MRLRNHVMKALVVAGALMMTACSGGGNSSTQAASGNGGSSGEQTFNLKLSHGLAEDHAVHIQLTEWVEQVKEKSGGTINIQIVPNAQLGSEADNISSIQAGALDLAKVSASTLGNFNNAWNALSVPYVFNDKDHYYNVMDGEIADELYNITEGDGFIGLTWLDSGSRSFYTAKTPIRVPADLKGLKIRTMDSQMAIDMMNALGGSATVMSYSEIYTGMQQGVVDGAENNITALRDHSDVAQYYCYDEHTRIPDIVVISTKVWNQMSDNQKSIMKETAAAATEAYKTRWAEFEEEVRTAAEANNVTFVEDVDTAAFQEACQSIYDNLKSSDPDVYAIVEKIQAAGK
ncbi:TRAP transporter substrate-binding protein [Lacrimispora sp. 210928-DFI.3.58]|uniref:TRAP transporter substrate-binding protein n=1 Tax=Lacrimispora sp. 210928-DFI.3.58 TaxID=2883214 RepID=UPI0015B58D85|nr:TRAP transporter substrate-binding protein [Lacrimispora sp. 210928-DFI.3.58]MCB7320559.1 TRAP transporter substrate-binding protein [Lacrimispora sp. 210928-DFI.3.58]